jgi:hypothetical protein
LVGEKAEGGAEPDPGERRGWRWGSPREIWGKDEIRRREKDNI